MLIFFLCGLIIEWLSAKLIPNFQGMFANLNPLDLFSTYIDNLLKHIAFAGAYTARVLKAFYIPDFKGSLAGKIVAVFSLQVTPFTAFGSTIVDFCHKFYQNPFNVVYASLELLIGGLLALPKGTYLSFGWYPRLFVRVFIMVLVGSIIGYFFYGIIWIFGALYGFILNISLAIPYAIELRMAVVEERTHWLLDSTVGRFWRRGTA